MLTELKKELGVGDGCFYTQGHSSGVISTKHEEGSVQKARPGGATQWSVWRRMTQGNLKFEATSFWGRHF